MGARNKSDIRLLILLSVLAGGWTTSGCESDNGGGEATPAPDAASEPELQELLPALWAREHAAGREEYELASNNKYTFRSFPKDSPTPTQITNGTWLADESYLTLITAGSKEVSPYVVNGDTLSRRHVYLRKSLGDGIEATWESRLEKYLPESPGAEEPGELVLASVRIDTLELFEDGTSSWSSEEKTGSGQPKDVPVRDRPGTWKLDGDKLTVTDTSDVFIYELHAERLYDTSASWLFTRVGPAE